MKSNKSGCESLQQGAAMVTMACDNGLLTSENMYCENKVQSVISSEKIGLQMEILNLNDVTSNYYNNILRNNLSNNSGNKSDNFFNHDIREKGSKVNNGNARKFDAGLGKTFNCNDTDGCNFTYNFNSINGYNFENGADYLCAPTGERLAQLVRTAPPGFCLHPPVQLTLHQLQALGQSVLGWQVLVQSTDGSYVGYICWMLDHCSRLGLEEVCRPSSGVRRVGLVLLYYRSVMSVTLLARRQGVARGAGLSDMREERGGRPLLQKKIVPPHLLERRRAQDVEGEEEEEEVVLPLPTPPGRLQRPNSWCVVDTVDQVYHKAVACIARQHRVGLSTVGRNVGRWGELAWLCVATDHTVFLFDVAELGLHAVLFGTDGPPQRVNKKQPNEVEAEKDFNVGHQDPVDKNELIRNDTRDVQRADSRPPLSKRSAHNSPVNDSHCLGASGTIFGEDVAVVIKQSVEDSSAGPNKGASTDQRNNKWLETNTLEEQRHNLSIDDHQLPESGRLQVKCKDSQLSSNSVEDCASVKPSFCLATLLEDADIEVVMHDSRGLCDLLEHQAGVYIRKLYDTQATEVYLHMLQHRGDCPAFVPPMKALLTRRLRLQSQHLLLDRLQRRCGGDVNMFFERPLSPPVMAGVSSSAVFLMELRHSQLWEMLADLRQLTAVHSSAYALKDDVMRARVEQHVVPAAVQQLGRRTVLNCLPPGLRRAGWGRSTVERGCYM